MENWGMKLTPHPLYRLCIHLSFLACRDVAMLLRDPYSLNAICKSILQCLLNLYEQSKLPRVSPSV